MFKLKCRLSSRTRKFYEKNPAKIVMKEFNRRVQSGPFKDMRYINKSHGSVLIPKIAGTYEKPIHPWIEEILSGQYANIVDIGCAEGYYAVGFAFRCKRQRAENTRIFAYDINEMAHANLRKLAALNGVEDFISIDKECNFSTLNSFEGKTFVFCDIEGAEEYLLDPAKASALLNYDLLVEVHDGGVKSSKIKDVLRRRFEDTHTIKIVSDSPLNVQDLDLITWIRDQKVKVSLLKEGRTYGLEWMYLKRNRKSYTN